MKPPEDGVPKNNLMPPPSVSKAGYMTEITTGTRQLAKASIGEMKKRRKNKSHIFVLPLEVDLEEFGTGQVSDTGRDKEFLSSPREDMHITQRLVCDTMANKERSFHRTMELRYNAEGELLEKPEADPVDLKYMKYGVRRPWSSKYKAPQAETPIPASGLSCKTPEEIEELRMLAVLEGCGSAEEKQSAEKLSTFYLTKLPRDTDVEAVSTQPCIGQYNPRYKIVHRTPSRPSDWGKASYKTRVRMKRPNTAQSGKVRAVSPDDKGGEEGKDRTEGRRYPNEYGKWVDRSRSALSFSKAPRPSSAFLSAERQTHAKSTTPDTYWPYNCHFARSDRSLDMQAQQPRWEGACGFQSRTELPPDVVYDTQPAKRVPVPCFSSQTPRSASVAERAATPSSHMFYNTNMDVLSSSKKVKTLNFTRTVPREPHKERVDTRKALNVSYNAVTTKLPGGVNYDTQRPREEYLHENPNLQLEYDARYDVVRSRPPTANMEWTEGHTRAHKTSSTAELDYTVKTTSNGTAPDMTRCTSRAHNFGAFVPLQMLDQVYDTGGAGSSKYCGLKFEKQVGREKRERALKQKLVRSDLFYDVPQDPVRCVIPFEKHLARNKRAPTKLRA